MVLATQGYWLARVQGLLGELALEKERVLALRVELDSAQLRVQDSELELVREQAQAKEQALAEALGQALAMAEERE